MKEYITSKSNEKIKTVRKLGEKKYRTIYGKFVIEGHKLLSEYLSVGFLPDSVFMTEAADKKYGFITEKLADTKIYIVTEDIYHHISAEQSPQGILAVCDLAPSAGALAEGPAIILESVRDAGNLGTVIRTAGALGIANIIISSDCADLYNLKTIRATMGALFRANIIVSGDLILTVKELRSAGRKIYAAMPDSNAVNVCALNFGFNDCIVVGNEGNGITDALVTACDGTVTIPMVPTAESLNASVAAAVLMWELVRGQKNESR